MEPPLDWLPRLPEHFRKRTVRAMTLAQAREMTERSFIKPTDEKVFPARVFATAPPAFFSPFLSAACMQANEPVRKVFPFGPPGP
jgi:hypothetical protein